MTIVENKVKNLPTKPGVYLFKDAKGEVLYVGKAKNLKARVKSYFQNGRDLEPRLLIMKQQIADLEYIVVSSEIESLILENNLIKQYQPRFNVLMRDDKNYQFIKLDYESEIPQIYTVRSIEESKKSRSKYFGPYTSGLSVKQTLHLLKDVFHLCRNKKITDKPCFAFHLGRCSGVCFGKISIAEYRETFYKVEDFLRHRQSELIASLKSDMAAAAKSNRFERAAFFRDRIRSLEHLWQRQKIVSPKKESQDYLGVYREASQAVVCLFIVREGKLIHTEYFEFSHADSTPAEILERFILQYYHDASDLPREIITREKLPNFVSLEGALSKIEGRRINIVVPQRGKKIGLLRLAEENASLYHERQVPEFEKQNPLLVLGDLAQFLDLPKPPLRIEGYDISNIQGTNPVGSMVVFTNGLADKSQYRKFKINIKDTPDDFAMMGEMLERRLKRLSTPPALSGTLPSQGEEKKENDIWPRPDLIIIDGGKGQLNVAVRVLREYKLQIPIIGLAKRLEEIFLPGQKISRMLPPNSPMLFLLQRIRDEAHRFAINFYRSRHRRSHTYSRLEDLEGVGPVTRRKLIKRFGSALAVKQASVSAIASEVGLRLAKKIKEQLS